MHWLTGSWASGWEPAAKAALMLLTAVAGLRLTERRTLAQWTSTDFATAVAIGGIMGRTAAADQSWFTGAAALLSLLVVHTILNRARFVRGAARVLEHPIRIVLADGVVRQRELHRCGLTESDLAAHLRQRGVRRYQDLAYVLYEAEGGLTVVSRSTAAAGSGTLAGEALDEGAPEHL